MGSKDDCDYGCCSGKNGIILLIVVLALVGGVAYLVGTTAKNGLNNFGNISLVQPQEHNIYVSGEALRNVAPDQLTVSYTIETEESTAKLSQDANSERSNAVLAALKAKGINAEDIQTTNYDLYVDEVSRWVCPDGVQKCDDSEKVYKRTVLGYKTVHTVSARTENVDLGGDMIDTVVKSGATRVNSIVFSLRDATKAKLEQELLREAGMNAKVKAQKIADGIGATLGKASSASAGYMYTPTSGNDYRYNAKMVEDAAMPQAAGTSVSGGQLTVSTSVSVTYQIQ
ncbi:MAG: SIMPL domain-containing protein [Candidatus Bilamarchaeaceae archaeon]